MNFLSDSSIIYYVAIYVITYIVFLPAFITAIANIIRKVMFDK